MANACRLKDVSDPKKVAPNGQTVEGRMQKLCVDVAEDIKRCANTCDTYLKFAIAVHHHPPVSNCDSGRSCLSKYSPGLYGKTDFWSSLRYLRTGGKIYNLR
jgi:hypothetical protein